MNYQWILFFTGMSTFFIGIFINNPILLLSGSALWLTIIVAGIFEIAKTYRKYASNDDERAIELFLAKQKWMALADKNNKLSNTNA